MDNKKLNPDILEKLQQLQEKYNLTGQNLNDNLEGLLHEKYLKYWDYIHLDTLLSLQDCKTQFPDEMIFLTYHQITELYFKLALWEIGQVALKKNLNASFFKTKLIRINRYFQQLTDSFSIMIEGMEVEQFRQFRMALLPSSGFQSAQFRKLEICSTDVINLMNHKDLEKISAVSGVGDILNKIYWKQGATDDNTSKETVTSIYFQEKYGKEFLELAEEYQDKNIWQQFSKLPKEERTKDLILEMKRYDYWVNVEWRLSHFKSAVRYLKNEDTSIDATGGTNWQKYLPPRLQKRMFFPALWTKEEKEEWGRVKFEELGIETRY